MARIRAPSWWNRFAGGDDQSSEDTPAWLFSLAIHVAALVALSLAVTMADRNSPPAITLTAPDVPEPEPSYDPLVTMHSEPPAPASGDSDSDQPPIKDVDPTVDPVPVEVEIPDLDDSDGSGDRHGTAPTFQDVSDWTPDLPDRPSDGTALPVGSTGEALDFLAAMILDSVSQRRTTVCWIFDRSLSLAAQRTEIATRIDGILAQVASNAIDTGPHELNHIVLAFGESVSVLTPRPVSAATDVVEAVEAVAIDESGVENTFQAVREAVIAARGRTSSSGTKNIRVIVFTDERGNDEHLTDSVALICTQQQVRVYVVGVPAPFGRVSVAIRFVEPDTERFAAGEQWAEVDQGPETMLPEFVRVNSGRYDDAPMDSGFGPFSLSKLCLATGGRYLCLHPNRRTTGRVQETAPMASRLEHFFEKDAMAPYRPDYVSAQRLQRDIQQNATKQALVEAATLTIEPLRSPRCVFPKVSDGAFVALVKDAQKQSAVLAPRIDLLHGLLASGQRDRPRIQEKRWQAGYDLALGQVLAAKVRIDAYNQILAQAKNGMAFRDARSDTWELVASNDLSASGSVIEKLGRQARDLLRQVVAEHPGTPWALIAAAELETPLGYTWRETFTNVRPPPPPGVGNAAKPADDRERPRLTPPKPPRPLRNL
jgi:hypothetical protein